MNTAPIRVVQYGLGPIGLESARAVLAKQDTGHIELVGAIDIDPNKVGKDLGELLGLDAPTGITVEADAERVLQERKPAVALHTTSSFLSTMYEQLVLCARQGVHVVSSTEELAYPYDRHPEIARRLDEAAREHGVVIVGTGVNPGYAMDTLALMATGVCTDVRTLRVERVVDAGGRRLPLQQKVGAGITAEAFAERKQTGTFGHIGLRESALLIADGLGWPIDDLQETLDPMMADEDVKTPFLTVRAGQVAGIHHAITAYADGQAVLSLDLKMYVGAKDPKDAVYVEGTPPISLVVEGGIFGDTATVAMLVNTVPRVLEATPGLKTMKDLAVPRAFATRPLAS
ncbi:dihydrodipicolinate reductase [Rhodothermaceae bacterium RA]|nr:dihydrodipicolinate reductase [Rhodothermaceae bacterium RA]